MTRPACEDCDRPADLAVRDLSRGYQASRAAKTPRRPICTPCLKNLQDAEAGDPWANWADPYIYTRYDDKDHAMTTTDTTALADQLAPLAAELADLAEKADAIKERQDQIKAQIRDLVPGPDKYAAGNLTLTVSTNTRFDEKRALGLIDDALKPLVTYPETRIDKDRLKVLAPDVYDAAQTTYDPRISIR